MEDYKQRIVNEYNELQERTVKLGFMLARESRGGLDFELSCPVSLLKAQYNGQVIVTGKQIGRAHV